MRVLLDTNILIYREDDRILDKSVQELMRALSTTQVLVHPASLRDLAGDTDEDRKKVVLSKIAAYPQLDHSPDYLIDQRFLNQVGSSSASEEVDNSILYAVFRNAVDFLITEDRGIHKKARHLGIPDRVLLIADAVLLFGSGTTESKLVHPPALKQVPMHNLDFGDPIFESLRQEYVEFDEWLKKRARDGSPCWVYHKEDGEIGALLAYKGEEEPIDCQPPLPKMPRLKIRLFKVTQLGQRIGELLVKLSIDYARKKGLDEVYLSHFVTAPEDHLVQLISNYGFTDVGRNRRGEMIFLKKLVATQDECKDLGPLEIARTYFPSFCDGPEIRKFIVPILPQYHQRLFTDFPGRQTTIPEHSGEFIIEGNTIRKAYVCHALTKRIRSGDIVCFYRSKDWRKITHVGVVEEVHRVPAGDIDAIWRLVAKRTAYSQAQIMDTSKKDSLVILFMQHFFLPRQIAFKDLGRLGGTTKAPQSIAQIGDDDFENIRRMGGIDEHFAVH
jgi:rRNA-processing protein FCF1